MQNHIAQWANWRVRCRDLLQSNQVQVGTYRYTRPAPMTYEQQWLWDSCFHALVYRHIDPAMAADELRSVVARQVASGPDAGMIPHMAYWDERGAEMWGDALRSIITQPPLIAVAALDVYSTSEDVGLLRDLYPALARYHRWFSRRRDPDRDGLVSLIHPWESGWDASPRWDGPMGLSDPTRDDTKQARHALVKALREHDCDVMSLADAGFFNVEALDFNAIRAADLNALAHIADVLNQPEEAVSWRAEAASVRQAIRDKMRVGGQWVDLSGGDETPIHVPSAAPFVLLFAGVPTTDEAVDLVAQLTTGGFATAYPVPTTPTDAPRYDSTAYWRGNVWMSVNWLIYRGLLNYSYTDAARHLAQRSLDLVANNGFYEYFNPQTGQGYGPSRQSWTTLVLDMLARERHGAG